MPILPFRGTSPSVSSTAWVAPDAWVIGDASVSDSVSIFFGAVLRGDILPITVGAGSNVQEGALLHTSRGMDPCSVGEDVTIGHHAIIHSCTIKDRCIIGMGATILDKAIVEPDCIIGANSLLSIGTVIPAGSLAFGSPARVVRKLTELELRQIRESAESYRQLGAEYRRIIPAS